MVHLEAVFDLTKQLLKKLNQPADPASREELIQQINEIIQERGSRLKKVLPPYTEKEEAMGEQIIELNKQIEKKMNDLFDELKIEMKQVNSQRKSNESYTNPYKDVQVMDGMFLDSKK